jgi:hypothetical protein
MGEQPQDARLLWPDPRTGPWLIRVWWRGQHGVPTPVGFSITSWCDDDPADSGPHNALPDAGDDVALPRVDGRLMRGLPMGKILDAAREQVRARLADELRGGRQAVRDITMQKGAAHGAVADARLLTRRDKTKDLQGALDSGLRGRDLGDDHYREVAAVYAQAMQEGRPPTKAVQEHFTVEKSTAAKKVARARERGFLPKTTRGRVGPVTEEL